MWMEKDKFIKYTLYFIFNENMMNELLPCLQVKSHN